MSSKKPTQAEIDEAREKLRQRMGDVRRRDRVVTV